MKKLQLTELQKQHLVEMTKKEEMKKLAQEVSSASQNPEKEVKLIFIKEDIEKRNKAAKEMIALFNRISPEPTY